MPKIMLEMVALGFQGVVILVLDFPTTAPGRHPIHHVMLMDRVICRKRIAIYLATFGGVVIISHQFTFMASSLSRKGNWLAKRYVSISRRFPTFRSTVLV